MANLKNGRGQLNVISTEIGIILTALLNLKGDQTFFYQTIFTAMLLN